MRSVVAGAFITFDRPAERQSFAWIRGCATAGSACSSSTSPSSRAGDTSKLRLLHGVCLFKLLIDAQAFGTDDIPDRPPGCLAGLVHAVAPKEDADALWKKSILEQRQNAARDEEVVPR